MNRYALSLRLSTVIIGLTIVAWPQLTTATTAQSPLQKLTVKQSKIILKSMRSEIKPIVEILKAEAQLLKQPNSDAKVDELLRLHQQGEELFVNDPPITPADLAKLQQQYPQSGIIRLFQLRYIEGQEAQYEWIKQADTQYPEHPVIKQQYLKKLLTLHIFHPQANWRTQFNQVREQWLTQNPTNLSIYLAALGLENDPVEFLLLYDRIVKALPNNPKSYAEPINLITGRNALTIDYESAIARLRQGQKRFPNNLELEWADRMFEIMVKNLKAPPVPLPLSPMPTMPTP
jgi:hypothetical protein